MTATKCPAPSSPDLYYSSKFFFLYVVDLSEIDTGYAKEFRASYMQLLHQQVLERCHYVTVGQVFHYIGN